MCQSLEIVLNVTPQECLLLASKWGEPEDGAKESTMQRVASDTRNYLPQMSIVVRLKNLAVRNPVFSTTRSLFTVESLFPVVPLDLHLNH